MKTAQLSLNSSSYMFFELNLNSYISPVCGIYKELNLNQAELVLGTGPYDGFAIRKWCSSKCIVLIQIRSWSGARSDLNCVALVKCLESSLRDRDRHPRMLS